MPVVTQFTQAALEVEHAATELAERYEEINLLYTISEILGRTVALEEATSRILSEISETVGARKAAVLVLMAASIQHVYSLSFWMHSDALFCLLSTAVMLRPWR